MSGIARNKIVKACSDGIIESFYEYLEWTSNEWLWHAPEYLITVNIAKKLWELEGSKFITLEDNIKNTLKDANAKLKGKYPKNMRATGRSDIIFWWAKGTPRGIIEVKNAVFYKSKIQEDLKRIYEILKKKSDIDFGCIAFFISAYYENGNATEQLYNWMEIEIIDKIEHEVEKENLKLIYEINEIESNEKNSSYSCVFMIHK